MHGIYQSARTEGKGKTALLASADFSYGSDMEEAEPGCVGCGYSGYAPNLRVSLNHGVTEKLDFSLAYGVPIGIKANLKMMFLGSNESKFAMSAMPGYGYYLGHHFHFPLLATFRIKKNMDLTLAPAFIHFISNENSRISSIGGEVNFQFGRKMQYNLAFSLYHNQSNYALQNPFNSNIGLTFKRPINLKSKK